MDRYVLKVGVAKDDGEIYYERLVLPSVSSENYWWKDDGMLRLLKQSALKIYLEAKAPPPVELMNQYTITLAHLDPVGDKIYIGSGIDLVNAVIPYRCDADESYRTPDNAPVAKFLAKILPISTQESGPAPPLGASAAGTQTAASPSIEDVIEAVMGIVGPAVRLSVQAVERAASQVVEAHIAAAAKAAGSTPSDNAAKAQQAPKPPTETTTTPETGRPFIHICHTCDECHTSPIVGERYHCLDKDDYDLCQTCYSKYDWPFQFESVKLDRDVPHQEQWYRRLVKFGKVEPNGGPRNVVASVGEAPPCTSQHSTTNPALDAVAPPASPDAPKQVTPSKAEVDFAPLLEELDTALKGAIRRSLHDLIGKMGGKEGGSADTLGSGTAAGAATNAQEMHVGSPTSTATTQTNDAEANTGEYKGGEDYALQKNCLDPPAAAASAVEDKEEAIPDEEESHSDSTSSSEDDSSDDTSSEDTSDSSSSSSSSSDDDDDDDDDDSSHQGSWLAEDEQLFASVTADSSAPSIAADDAHPQEHEQEQPPPSSSVLIGQLRELGFCSDANETALRAVIGTLLFKRALRVAALSDSAAAAAAAAAAAETVTAKHVLREYLRSTAAKDKKDGAP